MSEEKKMLSTKISTMLDNIGFNEEVRRFYINTNEVVDILDNFDWSVRGKIHIPLTMGSQAEGTTIPALQSDIDVIYYHWNIIAKTDISEELKPFQFSQRVNICPTQVLMFDDTNTPPGYVKLQVVQNGQIVNSNCNITNADDFLFEPLQRDFEGNHVLSNQFDPYIKEYPVDGRHGPAESEGTRRDFVRAYRCSEWPCQADEWLTRSRRHCWPSKETVKLLKKFGCFVVPVGQESSSEKDLQWRLSLSLQEKYLMHNMNPTQHKCYVLLKLMKKIILKPKCDVITSYHCKTVLFYTMECTKPEVWVPHKLCNCFHMCVDRLLKNVIARNCPNYFIPNENMFTGKIRPEDYIKIFKILNGILKNTESCLSSIFEKLSKQYVIIPSEMIKTQLMYDRWYTSVIRSERMFSSSINIQHCKSGKSWMLKRAINLSHLDKMAMIYHCRFLLHCVHVLTDHVKNTIHSNQFDHEFFNMVVRDLFVDGNLLLLYPLDGLLRYSVMYSKVSINKMLTNARVSYEYGKDSILMALDIYEKLVDTRLASLLAVQYVRDVTCNKSKEINLYFEMGKSVNTLCNRLKKAAVLLARRKHKSCENHLNTVNLNSTAQICVHTDHGELTTITNLFGVKSVSKFKFVTSCINYYPTELDVVPQALVYESFRSIGCPPRSRYQLDNCWFHEVLISPAHYFYFLKYLNCNALAKSSDANEALHYLEQTICSESVVFHDDTALNIMSYIYKTKGWTKLAVMCLKQSWAIQPEHNAAKWHLMFLLFSYK